VFAENKIRMRVTAYLGRIALSLLLYSFNRIRVIVSDVFNRIRIGIIVSEAFVLWLYRVLQISYAVSEWLSRICGPRCQFFRHDWIGSCATRWIPTELVCGHVKYLREVVERELDNGTSFTSSFNEINVAHLKAMQFHSSKSLICLSIWTLNYRELFEELPSFNRDSLSTLLKTASMVFTRIYENWKIGVPSMRIASYPSALWLFTPPQLSRKPKIVNPEEE